MRVLRCVFVQVLAATLRIPSAGSRIPLKETLMYAMNLVDFHLMAHYQYYTEAMLKYMEQYLEECHHQKNAFSRFHARKSTKMVSESLKMPLALDTPTEQESDPARRKLSPVAKLCGVDNDKMQYKSDIAQQHVEKSNINFVKMHFLKLFLDL